MNGLYYERSEAFARLYRLVLVSAFIFLHVLTPVALAKSLSLNYPRIMAESSTGDFMGCLYWATALIAFLWNTVYTATLIRHHIFQQNKPAITSCLIHLNYPCSIPSDTNVYKDEVTTLVAVIAIGNSALPAPIISTVCTWMVPEKEVTDKSTGVTRSDTADDDSAATVHVHV